MTGYPEALTDPSYYGQILVTTFPLIGNYGMPPSTGSEDWRRFYESLNGKVSGLIVENYSEAYSHHEADTSLAQWLYNQKIPAISGIDTRSLTRTIRQKGVMLGKIVIDDVDVDFYDPNNLNLVARVSVKDVSAWGKGKKRIVFVDCGSKFSILDELLNRDVELIRVP